MIFFTYKRSFKKKLELHRFFLQLRMVATWTLQCGTALPLPAHSSLAAGAQFCYFGGKVLPLRWENFAGAARELCDGGGRTLRRQSENCATGVGELCDGSGNTAVRF